MDNDFTVIVPCKRYIKAYLEKHCGNPVDLNFLDLQHGFRNYLKRRDIPLIPRFYPVTVTIRISEDDFYRNGFSIDSDDVLLFNKEIEQLIKHEMHIYLVLLQAAGGTVPEAITAFQNLYKINESDWSSESMKKEYDRNACSFIPRELKAMKTSIKINLFKQFKTIYD